jgi:hypothetical protein
VLLLTNRVCFHNELAQLLIQIIRLLQSEMMDVILPRNRVDPVEARPLVPMRQHQVPNDLAGLNLNRGEGHSHLECDARLFRQNGHWPATAKLSQEELVKFANSRWFALEMGFQLVSPAKMRLVSISELTPTNRAAPHRFCLVHGFHFVVCARL